VRHSPYLSICPDDFDASIDLEGTFAVCLSEGRGQNNQQPTPNDNKKQVVVFLCGSGI